MSLSITMCIEMGHGLCMNYGCSYSNFAFIGLWQCYDTIMKWNYPNGCWKTGKIKVKIKEQGLSSSLLINTFNVLSLCFRLRLYKYFNVLIFVLGFWTLIQCAFPLLQIEIDHYYQTIINSKENISKRIKIKNNSQFHY